MNIDDILKEPMARDVSTLLYSKMEIYGGPDLMKRMTKVFEGPEEAREWFYSNNRSLDYRRPYDVCKEGRVEMAFAALDAYERAEHGVLS